jgi:hypothetical protein
VFTKKKKIPREESNLYIKHAMMNAINIPFFFIIIILKQKAYKTLPLNSNISKKNSLIS